MKRNEKVEGFYLKMLIICQFSFYQIHHYRYMGVNCCRYKRIKNRNDM